MFPRAVETFSAGLPPDLQVPSSLNCRRRSFRSAMLSNRGPLEIVPLDAPLGGWPLRQKALEDAPRNQSPPRQSYRVGRTSAAMSDLPSASNPCAIPSRSERPVLAHLPLALQPPDRQPEADDPSYHSRRWGFTPTQKRGRTQIRPMRSDIVKFEYSNSGARRRT